MNPTTDFPQEAAPEKVMHRLIIATLVQAVVVLLAGLNLNLRFTAQPVGSLDLVRWRELFVLLVIVPVSVGIMFHVAWILGLGRRNTHWPTAIMGVFACLLGISMGAHEPVNAVFQYSRTSALHPGLAPSLFFWDEIFSHIIFYLAFAGISLSLLWIQVRNPLPVAMSLRTTAVFGGIAILGGTGIFLTLFSGCHWVDPAVIALVLLAAEWIRKGKPMRQLPIAMVVEWPCLLSFLGLVAFGAQRCLSGRW